MLHLKTIVLLANNWTAVGNGRYSQNVTLDCATQYSKVDIQPTEDQILALHNDRVEIQIINNNGDIKAYSYGGKPSINLDLQATMEETNRSISRRYETITVYADAWQGQDNVYTQPVYIKNLKKNEIVEVLPTALQDELLNDIDTVIFVKNDDGAATAYAVGYIPDINFNFNVSVTETSTDVYNTCVLPEEDVLVESLYY